MCEMKQSLKNQGVANPKYWKAAWEDRIHAGYTKDYNDNGGKTKAWLVRECKGPEHKNK